MRFPRSANVTLLANLFVSGIAPAIELPTEGRVYYEKWNSNSVSLLPARDVLVLVSRINVCDRNIWLLAESSTTGIDAHVVRTDPSGAFHVPPRIFNDVCSRVILRSIAFVPGYYSTSGRLASRSSYYAGANENDAILAERAPDTARISELANTLYSSFSSRVVTSEMKEQIYSEMLPEIRRLAVDYPTEWQRQCIEWSFIRELEGKVGTASCKSIQQSTDLEMETD